MIPVNKIIPVGQHPMLAFKTSPKEILFRMDNLLHIVAGADITVLKQDVTTLNPESPESPGDLVYIDPPYEGTTGYLGSFDTLDLVNRIPNPCCVSEAKALPGGQGVWISGGRTQKSVPGTRSKATGEW